jgi:hypothetical protein
VVTVLEKDNAFLRYDLQDVVRLNGKPCPCGESHIRLFYEGRVADIVPVGATTAATRESRIPAKKVQSSRRQSERAGSNQ